ncbi:hypothetical protein CBOM_01500 [Ceraceosorus bombacis]|uniref:Uncharacterized protein n=1 Tax=Ceraceosorus bombacis TaxID=401625 RepID=A0A0P1BDF8_9BASI|nr:hypothetical protein CBOM_01500 [Ceraceosorus bombacis]
MPIKPQGGAATPAASQVALISPLGSSIFGLHLLFTFPLGLLSLFSPLSLPLLEPSNSLLLLVRLYGIALLSLGVPLLLVRPLPDHLPGKRAVVLGILVYHGAITPIISQAPRVVPVSFGKLAETLLITPETALAAIHGLLAIGCLAWWQTTLPQTVAQGSARKRAAPRSE